MIVTLKIKIMVLHLIITGDIYIVTKRVVSASEYLQF